jgi:hypothetical protein
VYIVLLTHAGSAVGAAAFAKDFLAPGFVPILLAVLVFCWLHGMTFMAALLADLRAKFEEK